MHFTMKFIDQVKYANNIVDYFSKYTTLKRKGHFLFGKCPMPGHVDRTESFSISEEKQVYHCFGCIRSGNIFTAVGETKGLEFKSAVIYLAKRAGLKVPTIRKKH